MTYVAARNGSCRQPPLPLLRDRGNEQWQRASAQERTQRRRPRRHVARHLGQQIITGQYKPGQKLRELEIAKELDVSTNTVREAFHIVEKRHLVTIEPRRGAFVAEMPKGCRCPACGC